jgi:hypothetical protein
MLHKKGKKEPGNALLVGIKKEMAIPRMARSARITELNLDTARIPEQPSTTMSGTFDKIISSRRPSQPEKAQIAVDGADHRHRDLRIENTLADENGDDVRLKKRVLTLRLPSPPSVGSQFERKIPCQTTHTKELSSFLDGNQIRLMIGRIPRTRIPRSAIPFPAIRILRCLRRNLGKILHRNLSQDPRT